MKKVVALIESPLQFLNAQEYLMSLEEETQAKFLIFKDRGRKGNNELQLLKMLELYEERSFELHVINSSSSALNKLFTSLSHLLSLWKFKHSDILIIGDIRSSFFQLFALFLKCDENVSVDDGNATLHSFIIKNRINSLFKKNVLSKDNFFFFTIYSKFLNGVKVIENDYRYTKTRFQSDQIHSEFYVVGTTLVEVNILDSDQYFGLLENITKKVQQPLIYLQHRYEDPKKLQLISRKFGFEIHQCELPLEVETLIGRIKPHTFYGTISSFFDNIRFIDQSINVEISEIKQLDILDERSAKRLSKSYASYREYEFKFL